MKPSIDGFFAGDFMRTKLINRINALATECDLQVMEDLKVKSNDELLALFAELVLEAYLQNGYEYHLEQ